MREENGGVLTCGTIDAISAKTNKDCLVEECSMHYYI